jgi:hypothetical protein
MDSIHLLKLTLVSLLLAPLAFANDDVIDMDVAPYLVTAGDPASPIYANAGDNLRNGVGSIFIQFASGDGFICTASAISPTHVLTAAHCLRNGNDAVASLLFVLNAGQVGPSITPAIGFSVHPEFDLLEPVLGAFASGDIAVIELANAVPEGTETYALYRSREEVQKETQHYGHGRSGEGDEGATNDADFFYGRTGKNQYDATFAPLIGIPFLDQLIADFDNGTGENDAAPWWYSPAFLCPASIDNANANATRCNVARGQASQLRDKGFGALEIAVAPGDSGGPGFIDGQIAGVHSFGFTHGCGGFTGNVPDTNCFLDSSYGEMSGDTRVSNYAPWVDAIVASGSTTPVPEPLPVSTSGAGTVAPIELTEQARYVLENTVARTLKLKVK